LGGGLPIAAVVARPALFDVWATGGEALHTSTFLGHPLACAAALAVLDILDEEDLAGRAAVLGRRLAARLAAWPERHPALAAVRGRGLLWGLELTSAELAHRLAAAALRRGVLLLAGGATGDVAQIAPPLSVEQGQLDRALDLLEECLDEIR
jgi:4-aminobutyrate aminotransferase-like enzyme